MSEPKPQFEISFELIEKLNRIYNYFGGRSNKLEKLYQESGEFRDIFFLRNRTSKLLPEMTTEICDIISVVLQLLFNEEVLQDGLIKVIDKAILKIEQGYYE